MARERRRRSIRRRRQSLQMGSPMRLGSPHRLLLQRLQERARAVQMQLCQMTTEHWGGKPRTPEGQEIGFRFNSAAGCRASSCSRLHVCARCFGKRAISHHKEWLVDAACAGVWPSVLHASGQPLTGVCRCLSEAPQAVEDADLSLSAAWPSGAVSGAGCDVQSGDQGAAFVNLNPC
jgi:hypothetical protein